MSPHSKIDQETGVAAEETGGSQFLEGASFLSPFCPIGFRQTAQSFVITLSKVSGLKWF